MWYGLQCICTYRYMVFMMHRLKWSSDLTGLANTACDLLDSLACITPPHALTDLNVSPSSNSSSKASHGLLQGQLLTNHMVCSQMQAFQSRSAMSSVAQVQFCAQHTRCTHPPNLVVLAIVRICRGPIWLKHIMSSLAAQPTPANNQLCVLAIKSCTTLSCVIVRQTQYLRPSLDTCVRAILV